jgi:hypothetical protein
MPDSMETCLETSLGNTRRKSAVSLLQRLLQRLGKCGVSLFTDLFTPPAVYPGPRMPVFLDTGLDTSVLDTAQLTG